MKERICIGTCALKHTKAAKARAAVESKKGEKGNTKKKHTDPKKGKSH